MEPMYSTQWFETFAASVPASIIQTEIDGIRALVPRKEFPRVLDIACGVGRVTGPLCDAGYSVTGLDIHVGALREARRVAPHAAYVALDQRHVGQLRWRFDVALLMWNSLGFVGRAADLEMLHALGTVIRPGGKVIFDLYHPEWLRRNDRAGAPDERGAVVRRWTRGGRCFHEIRYPDGHTDDIQFEVYLPEEIRGLCRHAGLEPQIEMTWWDPHRPPTPEQPRYQLACVCRD